MRHTWPLASVMISFGPQPSKLPTMVDSMAAKGAFFSTRPNDCSALWRVATGVGVAAGASAMAS